MDIIGLSLDTTPAIKLFTTAKKSPGRVFKPSQSTNPTPSDYFTSPAPRSPWGTLQGHATR